MGALGELAAAFVDDQPMMRICWCRQTEQHLQETMDVRSGKQIPPARDMRDALGGVVHDNGQVVARRHVLALDDDISPTRRITDEALLDTGLIQLDERERCAMQAVLGQCQGTRHVEPHDERLAALNDESEVDAGRRGRAEMRVGSYLGVALPSSASTRFRADVAADIVPEDLGGKAADSLEATITPWWALSLSLGLEFGGR